MIVKIVCSKCGFEEEIPFIDRNDAKYVPDIAKELGWKVRKVGNKIEYICFVCKEEVQ